MWWTCQLSTNICWNNTPLHATEFAWKKKQNNAWQCSGPSMLIQLQNACVACICFYIEHPSLAITVTVGAEMRKSLLLLVWQVNEKWNFTVVRVAEQMLSCTWVSSNVFSVTFYRLAQSGFESAWEKAAFRVTFSNPKTHRLAFKAFDDCCHERFCFTTSVLHFYIHTRVSFLGEWGFHARQSRREARTLQLLLFCDHRCLFPHPWNRKLV